MTNITETTSILEQARAGRRAALASLHSRHGHSDKIVSIFNNAFPQGQSEADVHALRTAPPHRRVLVLSERVAA